MKLNKIHRNFFWVLIMISLFLFPGNPQCFAQSDPCAKESQKYCDVFKGKDPRKYYCLNQVYSQLSNDCKMAVKKMSAVPQQEFKDECREDFKKFCTKEIPGSGRIVECLRSHSKEVSLECRNVLNATP
jgi:hypothetical protein